MKNERGNVIALVLLILSVVSLIGAGTMLMSKYDMKFTSAFKSYDRGFNLADGANAAAYRDLETHDREQDTAFKDPNNPPPAWMIGCECKDWSKCKNNRASCPKCFDSTDTQKNIVGKFDINLQLLGYDTSPKPGWELGSYYDEQWDGLGVATPSLTTAFKSNVESAVLKTKSK